MKPIKHSLFQITAIRFGQQDAKYYGTSDNSPCFSSNLALATPQNINAFKDFINSSDTNKKTEAQFKPVIEEAFTYFKMSDDDNERSMYFSR